ncbi:hypothetical protein EMPG_15532 [Blastomyces silverae]|uniref:Uncharacterized protein n=1 Tax=Blastomyces silverae TaxID=2060906 RepID=A0A0H1BIP2_9EURO|nr:hypothetical protein EMPG_15532 [Blastomyces silverae]
MPISSRTAMPTTLALGSSVYSIKGLSNMSIRLLRQVPAANLTITIFSRTCVLHEKNSMASSLSERICGLNGYRTKVCWHVRWRNR